MPKVDGLVSGLDTSAIIKQLMELERRPIQRLEARIEKAEGKKAAYLDISSRMLGLSTVARTLNRATLFGTTAVESRSTSVLLAEGQFVANGSYQFDVRRLANSQQVLSSGFADMNGPVGRGQLRIEAGPAGLRRDVRLSELNGGAGVTPGLIRITDRGGRAMQVDLRGAVTAQDVVDAINGQGNLTVEASIRGGSFVLSSTSGESAGPISVQDLAGGTTAADLGLRGQTAGDEHLGSRVRTVGDATRLSSLLDGAGIDDVPGNDFVLKVGGATATVDITGIKTLGELRQFLEGAVSAAGADLDVSYGADGSRLVLSAANGVDAVEVTDLSGVARQLGIEGAPGGSVLTGKALVAGLSDTLLSSLHGGAGIPQASLRVTDRLGNAADIDLSAAETAQQVIDLINGNGVAQVEARINATGNGFELVDKTGVTDPSQRLRVEEAGSAVAQALGLLTELGATADSASGSTVTSAGLAGLKEEFVIGRTLRVSSGAAAGQEREILGYDAATGALNLSGDLAVAAGDGLELVRGSAGSVSGSDLDRRWVSLGSKLSLLQGGQGIPAGRFRLTNTQGQSATIDLKDAATLGLRGLATRIESSGLGVELSVNATGDGLTLRDYAGGAGQLKVEDLDGGVSAARLGLAGTAGLSSPDRIHADYEYVMNLDGSETLRDVQLEIADFGAPLSATVINDGSVHEPYRLSIIGKQGGPGGEFSMEFFGVEASATTVRKAREAVVVFGDTGGKPVQVTSGSNEVKDLVAGMKLTLVSTGQATVDVSKKPGEVVSKVQELVDKVNELNQSIDELTKFDTEKLSAGLLFGDGVLRRVRSDLEQKFIEPIKNLSGSYSLPAQLGFTVGQKGVIEFDASKLQAALASNPQAVEAFFTQARLLDGDTKLSDFNDGFGVDISPTDGVPEFRVKMRDGTAFDVDVTGAKTANDVLRAINLAPGNPGTLLARIAADGRRFELSDGSGGSGELSVETLDNSQVANQLGFPVAGVFTDVLEGRQRSLRNPAGFAGRMAESLQLLTNPLEGTLARRTEGMEKEIESHRRRITDTEKRLVKVELRLSREFASLETILSESQNTMQRLQSQFSSLAGISRR